MVRLRTHLDVKEDSLTLFGFLTRDQLDMFRMLTSVARVGSRVALTVLSVLEVEAIAAAVIGGDHAAFDAVPGIGKKLAQRIVLELAEKVGKRWAAASAAPASVTARVAAGGAWELARDALLAQGFKAPEVEDRLRWARAKLGDDGRVGDIVREALRFGG
jgi:Holliday junction DNA helicase RuvA